MKKIIAILLSGVLVASAAQAQYFQATFEKDPDHAANNRVNFKMRPTGSLTTGISYIEFAFRYPTATTPPFVVAGIQSNTALFPGLNMQRFLPDIVEGGYTYVRFVHNTGVIASNTYTPIATGYQVFSIAFQGTPATISQIEMASDMVSQTYVFGVVDGSGILYNPTGDQLYGPGFNVSGNLHLLPLSNVTVPVKFNGFSATKKDNDGLLNWAVENESPITDRYEIERSFNGVDFGKFATVAPKNNGSGSNVYNLTDANLSGLRTSSAVIYYRIKQIDKDGQFVYSEIRSIRLDSKGFAVGIYPNPVKDMTVLSIDLIENEQVLVSIFDAAGKQVQQMQIQGVRGLNVKRFSMAAMAAGTYQLKVKTNNETKTLSVVKE
jgi:hypothetical protein